MKVDFMIIGSMKSGTSTLAEMLRHHRQVSFSNPKETHYFVLTEDWQQELDRYHSHFEPQDGVLYGEGSPSYTAYPHNKLDIPGDLHAYNPELKFIYLMRHPVDRAISQYMHMYERGGTNAPLEKAIIDEPRIINFSRYHMQLQRYLRYFSREQILLLDFADLVKDQAGTAKTVAEFLGIDPEGYAELDLQANPSIGGFKLHKRYEPLRPLLEGIRNVFPEKQWTKIRGRVNKLRTRNFETKPTLDATHQQVILDLLQADTEALETLWGRDLSAWKRVKG